MTDRARLNVGLIGVGRLGRIYARELSTRIPAVRLTAVADVDPKAAETVAGEFDVPRWYGDSGDLLADGAVDAVVIASPTRSHCALTEAAVGRSKAVFCEKPPALTLDEALAMKAAVDRAGAFFQLGFMRRFDRGYAAARRQLDAGAIGDVMLFKSTSRDPYRPSLDYIDPRSSGGLMIDMGIHDFDLGRWFMGEVERVHAAGAVLAYPELGELGDVDNAIVTLVFRSGKLGVVDLTRKGVYGYDINTELVGTLGTLRVGYLRETPLLVMKEGGVTHDTVPYFPERFREAYVAQLENFAGNVIGGKAPPITVDDGVESLCIGIAATRAYRSGKPVTIKEAKEG
jgi:inositol 2-dehydrogenase